MKYSLINPDWTFGGSIYFGCREPHLPLEYGYAKALLERVGHDVLLIDGHRDGLPAQAIAQQTHAFAPDIIVITTAPSYLFWRCAPPELRAPLEIVRAVRESGALTVAVGPHGSTTPEAVMKKLGVDRVIRGEPEEVLPLLAQDPGRGKTIPSVFWREEGGAGRRGTPHESDMAALPALRWPREVLARRRHHHHRFDCAPGQTGAPGAEVESSRGCPYSCSFCARETFRGRYRRRPVPVVLEEIDDLVSKGVSYLYFIDELFMPDSALLAAVGERDVAFGIQTRIDLWTPELLERLGAAGCVSIEAGIESASEAARLALGKRCMKTNSELIDLLKCARDHVPFVQATLLASDADDPALTAEWRDLLLRSNVWTNEPVPLFPYPGSQEYAKRWGPPDEYAWERAHGCYLQQHSAFSDIQEERPLPLARLEAGGGR
ncbi:MAG: TIGR04295 family B12-binding domain-containing radical SAM protein [Nitrospirota bacterium]